MILVTGVNGFVGKHLVNELFSRKVPVIGLGKNEPKPDPLIENKLDKYFQCDITSKSQVKKLDLKNVDCVINLAGLANVGISYTDPELYNKINVEVFKTLASEFYTQNKNGRFIAISSCAVYKPNKSGILEEGSDLISDGSPYALSKLAMENEAIKFQNKGLDCVIARPFNHIGPGQSLGFIVPDMVWKLKNLDIEKPELVTGNIDTIRDYTDVRDIVKAYCDIALSQPKTGPVYNICSSEGRSGREIIKHICNSLGIDYNSINFVTDTNLIRPNDPQKHVGDHSLITNQLGWEPKIQLQETIDDIVRST